MEVGGVSYLCRVCGWLLLDFLMVIVEWIYVINFEYRRIINEIEKCKVKFKWISYKYELKMCIIFKFFYKLGNVFKWVVIIILMLGVKNMFIRLCFSWDWLVVDICFVYFIFFRVYWYINCFCFIIRFVFEI